LDKDKSSEKIDGIAAVTMAADRIVRSEDVDGGTGASAYDDDGIFVL
jgi:hypothetical protein